MSFAASQNYLIRTETLAEAHVAGRDLAENTVSESTATVLVPPSLYSWGSAKHDAAAAAGGCQHAGRGLVGDEVAAAAWAGGQGVVGQQRHHGVKRPQLLQSYFQLPATILLSAKQTSHTHAEPLAREAHPTFWPCGRE